MADRVRSPHAEDATSPTRPRRSPRPAHLSGPPAGRHPRARLGRPAAATTSPPRRPAAAQRRAAAHPHRAATPTRWRRARTGADAIDEFWLDRRRFLRTLRRRLRGADARDGRAGAHRHRLPGRRAEPGGRLLRHCARATPTPGPNTGRQARLGARRPHRRRGPDRIRRSLRLPAGRRGGSARGRSTRPGSRHMRAWWDAATTAGTSGCSTTRAGQQFDLLRISASGARLDRPGLSAGPALVDAGADRRRLGLVGPPPHRPWTRQRGRCFRRCAAPHKPTQDRHAGAARARAPRQRRRAARRLARNLQAQRYGREARRTPTIADPLPLPPRRAQPRGHDSDDRPAPPFQPLPARDASPCHAVSSAPAPPPSPCPGSPRQDESCPLANAPRT